MQPIDFDSLKGDLSFHAVKKEKQKAIDFHKTYFALSGTKVVISYINNRTYAFKWYRFDVLIAQTI